MKVNRFSFQQSHSDGVTQSIAVEVEGSMDDVRALMALVCGSSLVTVAVAKVDAGHVEPPKPVEAQKKGRKASEPTAAPPAAAASEEKPAGPTEAEPKQCNVEGVLYLAWREGITWWAKGSDGSAAAGLKAAGADLDDALREVRKKLKARQAELEAAAKKAAALGEDDDEIPFGTSAVKSNGNGTPEFKAKITPALTGATKLREVLNELVSQGFKTKAALTAECLALAASKHVPVLSRISDMDSRIPQAAEYIGITE